MKKSIDGMISSI